jgi:hypothetical protein
VGGGVKIGPEKWGGVAVGGAEKGFQTVFNNYDLYGRDGIKYFGSGFYWKSFVAGALAGGLKEGIDWRLDKIRNFKESGFQVGTIGFNSVAADVTKKIALKSMSKDYKKYLNDNKKDDWQTFFNGFAQTMMFHFGE